MTAKERNRRYNKRLGRNKFQRKFCDGLHLFWAIFLWLFFAALSIIITGVGIGLVVKIVMVVIAA